MVYQGPIVSSSDKTIEAVFFGIIILASVVFNITLMVIICRSETLRTTTHAIIVSMAAGDILTAILCMPVQLLMDLGHIPTTETNCLISASLIMTIPASSCAHLFLATIERYLLIAHPFKYVHIVTPKVVKGMMVFLWISSVLAGTMPWMG